MTNEDIREAVRECMRQCLSAETPLDVIANYISHLRSRNWPGDDARTVELVVVKVLSRMIEWPEEMIDDLSGSSLPKHWESS